jgi:hypothetical protein
VDERRRPWHGAKHLETAGKLAKESGSSLVEVPSLALYRNMFTFQVILSESIQGTFREQSGKIQGTFREHSGNTQGVL